MFCPKFSLAHDELKISCKICCYARIKKSAKNTIIAPVEAIVLVTMEKLWVNGLLWVLAAGCLLVLVRFWRASRRQKLLLNLVRFKHPQTVSNPIPGLQDQWGQKQTFVGNNGVVLRSYCTLSVDEKGLGAVLFLPDYGVSCDTYAHVAQELAQMGYTVYGFDYMGSGASGDTPGVITSLEGLLADVKLFAQNVRDEQQQPQLNLTTPG
jgi:hypothetical protein